MDLSTMCVICDGLVHNTTCVWFYHSTYKWTCPQYHMCDFIIPTANVHIHNTTNVIWSFHLQMNLSTCVWFYHSTYKWTCPQYHMCVILSFQLQMDISTIPHMCELTIPLTQWTYPHVCDFIIPPTNGHIHMCFYHSTYKWTYPHVFLSFHLHMDIFTCVWLYHSTYKWTYPHVILSFHLQMDISTCDFIIPPTNGHIHMWFYHSTYKWTYSHSCDFIIPPTNGFIDCLKCLAVSFFFINPNENVDSLSIFYCAKTWQ